MKCTNYLCNFKMSKTICLSNYKINTTLSSVQLSIKILLYNDWFVVCCSNTADDPITLLRASYKTKVPEIIRPSQLSQSNRTEWPSRSNTQLFGMQCYCDHTTAALHSRSANYKLHCNARCYWQLFQSFTHEAALHSVYTYPSSYSYTVIDAHQCKVM